MSSAPYYTSMFAWADPVEPTTLNETYTMPAASFSGGGSITPAYTDLIATLSGIEYGNVALRLPEDPEINEEASPSFPTADIYSPVFEPITQPSFGPAPTLDAQVPDINLNIDAPTPFTGSAPAKPDFDPVTLPEDVDITLEPVPTFEALNLPDSIELDMPVMEYIYGVDELLPPTEREYQFAEEEYNSSLLTRLSAILLEQLDLSTGIPADVEQQLWQRGKERADAEGLRLESEITDNFASRGFSIPTGVMIKNQRDAARQLVSKNAEMSREITIKQAELEQSNRHQIIASAIQHEGQLIQYKNEVAKRLMEAERLTLQFNIDYYNLLVARHTSQVELFRSYISAYSEQVRGELARLEKFRAEIEHEKLIGEINIQKVELYKAQLQSALAIVDIYKGRVEAAKVGAEANRVRAQVYGEEVRAFGAEIQAKATEYDGYSKQIEAEVAKGDLYKAQVGAFAEEVRGYLGGVQAETEKANLEIRTNYEVPMEIRKGDIDAYSAQVQAEAARISSFIERYRGDINAYSAQVQAVISEAQTNTKIYDSNIAIASKEGDLRAALVNANSQIGAAYMNANSMIQRADIAGRAQVASAQASTYNYSISKSESHSNVSSNSSSRGSTMSNSFNTGQGRTDVVSYDGGEIGFSFSI